MSSAPPYLNKAEIQASATKIAQVLQEYANCGGYDGGFAVFGLDGSGGAFYTAGSCPSLTEAEISFAIRLGSGDYCYESVTSALQDTINNFYPERDEDAAHEKFLRLFAEDGSREFDDVLSEVSRLFSGITFERLKQIGFQAYDDRR